MNNQLELFADDNSRRFAIIFCSCIMEDQFGQVWFRKELYKSNLSEDAAKNLTTSLNSSLLRSNGSFYEIIPEVGSNFLIP